MTINASFNINDTDTPIIAIAIHDGHDLRDEVANLIALDDLERLREEDPFTGEWAKAFDNHIIVHTSRFEVDLNRSNDTAVYINPENAWGLKVWKSKPDANMVRQSISEYDTFYNKLNKIYEDFNMARSSSN